MRDKLAGFLAMVCFVAIFAYVLSTNSSEDYKYQIRTSDNSVYFTNNYEIDSVTNCINFDTGKKGKIKICGTYTITEKIEK